MNTVGKTRLRLPAVTGALLIVVAMAFAACAVSVASPGNSEASPSVPPGPSPTIPIPTVPEPSTPFTAPTVEPTPSTVPTPIVQPTLTVEPTPTLTVEPTPTLEPTPSIEPTPFPTPIPTPSAVPPPSQAELTSACDRTPIAGAAPYVGRAHPLVVVDEWGDLDPISFGINAKWFDGAWPGPIQLVVCVRSEHDVRVGTCGTYKRTSDGKVGQVIRFRRAQVVQVIVARTGKTLRSQALYGSTPACANKVTISSSPPPWKIYGSFVSHGAINKYATSTSTQKVK